MIVAVATALWAVLPSMRSSAHGDRPQAGGYKPLLIIKP